MTAKKVKRFSACGIAIVLLMIAISELASTPKIDRSSNLGAVGNRKPRSGGLRTISVIRGPDRQRYRLKPLAAVALALVLIVAAVACFAISPRKPEIAKSSSTPWTIYTIDSNLRGAPSVAIDSSGNVYISYYGSEGLTYATSTDGSWTTYLVDNASPGSSNGWPRRTSLAIDSNDKAHVSYNGGSAVTSLKYATNVDGSWSNYTIESGLYGVGGFNSIALDSSNRAHISYNHHNLFDLKYATNINGSWERYRIEHGGFDTGVGNSIALDSNNKVHISYVSNRFELRYATNSNGSWETYTLAYPVPRGADRQSTSIALDSNNKVHISYNSVGGSLMYATNANGSWVHSSIDNIPAPPQYYNYGFIGISLALDSNEKAHISYHPTYDPGNPESYRFLTKYATDVNGNWETFTIENITAYTSEWYFTSLALDSNNNVHITYDTPEGVKYATNAEPVIPEFGTAGVIVVIIATACIFVAVRRASFPSTKE